MSVEERYLTRLANQYAPDPEPVEDVQLAAGPSDTMTDGGPTRIELNGMATPDKIPRVGRAGVPYKPPSLSDAAYVGGAMMDMGAATVKGATQGFIGLPGDLEGIGRMVLGAMGVQAGDKTVLPTTDEVRTWLNSNVGQVGNGQNPYESMGEVVAPGGQVKAGMAVGRGAKALAPKAGEMVIDSMNKLGTPVQMNIVQPGPNVVSTRLPTAVKATEDPLASKLNIDLQSAKSDPEAFSHNMGLVKQYPNFLSKARSPDKQAEDFITSVKDNLLYLHDAVPDATRQRSKLWYDGARNITERFSTDYGVPDQAVSGVLAVLSPQKDWFMNVSLGQRVLDIMTTKQATKWDGSMDEMAKVIWSKPQYAPMVESIRGKTLAEITDPGLKAMWLRTYDQAHLPRGHQVVSPEGDFVGARMNSDGKTPTKTGWGSLNEIGKAVVILEDPSLETISKNLGAQHKVRNFYNNIYAPNDQAGHVTIDTHAVAAGLLRPLSGNSREVMHNFGSGVVGEGGPKNSSVTGVQGTYGLYAEAYRRAAQERGILPREMQSITWEAVRGLFTDTFKSQAKNVEQVDGIWLKYKKGQLSLDEARNEVIRTAGGINAPEWERAGLRSEPTQAIQPSDNTGELSGSSLPRGSAAGVGSRERSGTTAGNPAAVEQSSSENSAWVSREDFTAYINQPKQLKGFKTNAQNKGFSEQNYKHAEFVEVKFEDGTTQLDAIRGLNKTHAISRAFGNWPNATAIKPLARSEVEKLDPDLVNEVESAMGAPKEKK